jgi:hypothetical protein
MEFFVFKHAAEEELRATQPSGPQLNRSDYRPISLAGNLYLPRIDIFIALSFQMREAAARDKHRQKNSGA